MSLSFRNFVKDGNTIRLWEGLLGVLAPVLFFVFVLYFSHQYDIFEYDTDEGMVLMWGFLHAKGFVLYKEIWMDQPPFLILLLSGIIRIFGPSVYQARLLILGFSTLLLWAVFQIIKKTQNAVSALLTVILIVFSSFYMRLSMSVMIGLPALALAMLSCWAILRYQESYQRRYLLLSGVLLGLGLQTKFFVIVFLPAIICEIVMIEKNRLGKGALVHRSLGPISCWLMALIGIYCYMAFIMTSMDFFQIIHSYVKGGRAAIVPSGYLSIKKWFLEDYDIGLWAMAAIAFLKGGQKKLFCIPLITFILGVLTLIKHNPMWYHHRLLVLIPMCWLASYSFCALFNKRIWAEGVHHGRILKKKNVLTIFLLSALLVVTVSHIPFKYKRALKQMKAVWYPKEDRLALHLIKQYSDRTHLVFTDRPIFAFYANLPVHPYLATYSYKRFITRLLTYKDIIRIIDMERPELILFARGKPISSKIISQRYHLEYQNPSHSIALYVLRALKEDQ